jgi:hypothetical protein
LGSSFRSRSVPNVRHGSRNSIDMVVPQPLINVQDYNNLDAPSRPQLWDTGELTEGAGSTENNIEMAHDAPPAVPHTGGGLLRSQGDSDFMLSLRSRKSADSDAHSNSETIVPRRNLTVLDVAALIFNKMVSSIGRRACT